MWKRGAIANGSGNDGGYALLRGASPWMKPSVAEAKSRSMGRCADGMGTVRCAIGEDIRVYGDVGISGIRSIHMSHGRPDFTKHNGRYEMMPRALKRGTAPKAKTPLPIEKSQRAVMAYRIHGGIRALLEIISGAVTSFYFPLRGQKLENPIEKDIAFDESNGVRFVTFFLTSENQ